MRYFEGFLEVSLGLSSYYRLVSSSIVFFNDYGNLI